MRTRDNRDQLRHTDKDAFYEDLDRIRVYDKTPGNVVKG